MTVARSVGDVLSEHVVFEVDASTACMSTSTCRDCSTPPVWWASAPAAGVADRLDRAAGQDHRRVQHRGAPVRPHQRCSVIDFAKGQRKDDVMHEHLARFSGTEGVLFVGRAQEKTKLFRTEKRRDANGDSYPWIVKTTGLVNHFYFYCYDDDFGPFFLKFCSYFPYNAKLCINGNHWAQRQAAKAGIAFEALDNGFAAVDDPVALQAICDRLGEEQIDALLRKWLARLPHPFTAADRAAGYRYELSILQAEFSLTQMLDKPVSGRMFFEHVIRDNLDIGRPDQVALVFDRRLIRRGPHPTPGPFRTRVITAGVTPSLYVDYKHTRIKQYHKQGRALRTETTVNDTRDFSIGKRLTNLPALRRSASPPTGVCCTSNDSATTRSPAPPPCTPSPTRSPPPPGRAYPACGWPTGAATPCCPHCWCSAASPTDSPTPTCARSPASCAASTPARHRRADHLRPAPAQTPRPDHPHPRHAPLPGHRPRP